ALAPGVLREPVHARLGRRTRATGPLDPLDAAPTRRQGATGNLCAHVARRIRAALYGRRGPELRLVSGPPAGRGGRPLRPRRRGGRAAPVRSLPARRRGAGAPAGDRRRSGSRGVLTRVLRTRRASCL